MTNRMALESAALTLQNHLDTNLKAESSQQN